MIVISRSMRLLPLLSDGRVARYNGFRTNRPLHMDGNDAPNCGDSSAPGRYGWKQPARVDEIEQARRGAERSGDEVALA